MMETRWRHILLASLILTAGCARNYQMEPPVLQSAFSERAGTVTEADLFVRLPRALARHGFLIELQELRSASYIFETQWKLSGPDQGGMYSPGTARTRLRFKARPEGSMYGLRFEADYEVLGVDDAWHASKPDRELREGLMEILADVRSELTMRLRRY
jgi:hypothetical protein